MGYGPEVEGGKVGHCVMELAANQGVSSYRVGSGFQAFGIRAGTRLLLTYDGLGLLYGSAENA